jgi:hypothetical protein
MKTYALLVVGITTSLCYSAEPTKTGLLVRAAKQYAKDAPRQSPLINNSLNDNAHVSDPASEIDETPWTLVESKQAKLERLAKENSKKQKKKAQWKCHRLSMPLSRAFMEGEETALAFIQAHPNHQHRKIIVSKDFLMKSRVPGSLTDSFVFREEEEPPRPLFFAALRFHYFTLATELLNQGINPDTSFELKTTFFTAKRSPLHLACMRARPWIICLSHYISVPAWDAVEFLLAHGANASRKDEFGILPEERLYKDDRDLLCSGEHDLKERLLQLIGLHRYWKEKTSLEDRPSK